MPKDAPALPGGFDAAAAGRAVLARCDRLAEHTDEPGRTTRLFLTDAARAAQDELKRWMADAGLAVRADAAGNVIGRRAAGGSAATTNNTARTLLLGSHIDTVPGAGKYDGVLGVLVALAAVEALGDTALPFHVDVIAFSEEEGVRFALPYLGSAAVAGAFDPAWLDRRDAGGVTLREAIERFGLDPGAITAAAYDPAHVLGYTEVHLEQGPVLEQRGVPVGVVSGIQGQSRLRVCFTGQAAHAGTVPMDRRRDALVGASRFAVAVREQARAADELRATVGRFDVQPNVRNAVPGSVELSMDVRHADDAVHAAAVDALLLEALRIADEEGLAFHVVERQVQPATPVGAALAAALTDAVRDAGVEPAALPSGAGHDAVAVAALCPVAMLFVRHPGGVSHHPDERVDAEDAGVAVEVLARYLRRLADRNSGTLPA